LTKGGKDAGLDVLNPAAVIKMARKHETTETMTKVFQNSINRNCQAGNKESPEVAADMFAFNVGDICPVE
jgi:hypothetical protein